MTPIQPQRPTTPLTTTLLLLLLLLLLAPSTSYSHLLSNNTTTIPHHHTPRSNPPSTFLADTPSTDATASLLSCTTYGLPNCDPKGGTKHLDNLVYGTNHQIISINSVVCNRDLKDDEQLDFSVQPPKMGKRGTMAEEDFCGLFVGSAPGKVSRCWNVPRRAGCYRVIQKAVAIKVGG